MEVNGYKIGPEVDLRGASLDYEDLTGANLQGANLMYACLEGSNLSGVNLRNARLDSASLFDATLAGADLRGADFEDASLPGADLRGADLRGACLRCTDFFGANLTGAQIDKADLSGARFWCADLTGVALTEAQLVIGANFSGAILDDPDGKYTHKNSVIASRLKQALRETKVQRELYNDIRNDYDDYGDYIEAADCLISFIIRCIESALCVVMPRGEHRLEVIIALKSVAGATHRYNDPESEESKEDLCDNLIYYLDLALHKILNPTVKKRGKADVPRFLSEIGFKIDVEVNATPDNQDSIEARLDQLSSDVANLAGISKEETPAKTILAAIEASNLTPRSWTW